MEQFKKDVRAALSDLYLPPRTPEENLKREMVDEATQSVDQVSVAPQKKTLAELAAEKEPPRELDEDDKAFADVIAEQISLSAKRTNPAFSATEQVLKEEIVNKSEEQIKADNERVAKRLKTQAGEGGVPPTKPPKTSTSAGRSESPKSEPPAPEKELQHKLNLVGDVGGVKPPKTIDALGAGEESEPDQDAARFVEKMNAKHDEIAKSKKGAKSHILPLFEVGKQVMKAAAKLPSKAAKRLYNSIESIETATSARRKIISDKIDDPITKVGEGKTIHDLPETLWDAARGYMEGQNDGSKLPSWAKNVADVYINFMNGAGKTFNNASRLYEWIIEGNEGIFTKEQKDTLADIKNACKENPQDALQIINNFAKTQRADAVLARKNYLTHRISQEETDEDIRNRLTGKTSKEPRGAKGALYAREGATNNMDLENPFVTAHRHIFQQLSNWLVAPHAIEIYRTARENEMFTPTKTKKLEKWLGAYMGHSQPTSTLGMIMSRFVGGVYHAYAHRIFAQNIIGGQSLLHAAENSSPTQLAKAVWNTSTKISPKSKLGDLPEDVKDLLETTELYAQETMRHKGAGFEKVRDYDKYPFRLGGAFKALDWIGDKFPLYRRVQNAFGEQLQGMAELFNRTTVLHTAYKNAEDVLIKQRASWGDVQKKLNTSFMDNYELTKFAELIASGNRKAAAYFYARTSNRFHNFRYDPKHYPAYGNASAVYAFMKFWSGNVNKYATYAKNAVSSYERGDKVAATKSAMRAMAYGSLIGMLYNSLLGSKDREQLKKDGVPLSLLKGMATSAFGTGNITRTPLEHFQRFAGEKQIPSAAISQMQDAAKIFLDASKVFAMPFAPIFGQKITRTEANKRLYSLAKSADFYMRNQITGWRSFEQTFAYAYGLRELNILRQAMEVVAQRKLGKPYDKYKYKELGDFMRSIMGIAPPKPKTNAGATPPAQSKESEPFDLDDNLGIGNLDLKF